jgi:hypothetical protein
MLLLRRGLDADALFDFGAQPWQFAGQTVDVARVYEHRVGTCGQRRIRTQRQQIGRMVERGRQLDLGRAAPREDLRARRCLLPAQDERTHQGGLREDLLMREMPADQRAEFRTVQLMHVKCVRVLPRRRIDRAVRRADEQPAPGAQNAFGFAEKPVVILEMLQRLQRHDEVDAGVAHRDGGGAALAKTQMIAGIGGGGMLHRTRIDIDADDAGGDLCQQRAAIALARRDIEHIGAGGQLAGHKIPVEMFDLGLQPVAGRQALIGPLIGAAGPHTGECFIHAR